MNIKINKNYLLFYFTIFVQLLILNYCYEYKVNYIDPPYIKIRKEIDTFEFITLMFNKSFTQEEKTKKILILKNNNNHFLSCSAAEEMYQDEYAYNKIVFKLDKNLFLNNSLEYGKYILYRMNSDTINYDKESILIFLNFINFKNPIHAYELTGENQIVYIKYRLESEIEKEYINRIIYKDDLNQNIMNLALNYQIDPNDKKNLIIGFPIQNSPKNITFFIFPEYDKELEINEVDKVYLHFQDFILLNDAIYKRRNDYQNSLVSFQAQFRDKSIINTFLITDNHGNSFNCESFECNNFSCICNFYLGYIDQPGKLIIEYLPLKQSYITQKRDLFLILYETSILKCYKKDIVIDLELIIYLSEDMEYDIFLYFNDTSRKSLTRYERPSLNSIKVNKFVSRSSTLSSGTFSIISLIPDLNTNYNLTKYNINPVDDYSLYLTIYPGLDLYEYKTSIIYTNNDTDQIIIFNLSNAGALNEIILRKLNELNHIIKISKINGDCSLTDNNIFACNLKNIIYNYGNEYEGNYSVFYLSPCDMEMLKIEGRIITIKKGLRLLSISPKYIFEDEIVGKELTFQYNSNLSGHTIYIYIASLDNILVGYYNNPTINNEFVILNFDRKLNSGYYYIKTRIGDDIIFDNKNIGFRVIKRIENFVFNHHFFVINNNASINHLIIKVNDTTNTFGCIIEEDNRKINLTMADNCKTFYYNINMTGQIFFNYYYKDTKEKILIPINDYINVASKYTNYFDFFSLKKCYYYKFEINIKYYNNLPCYFVFLYNPYKNISLFGKEKDSLIKYTYNRSKNSYYDFINNDYYLVISEGYEDSNIYLYKSKLISFTDIQVPQFIIKPNSTIIYNNIFCNLNESIFQIKKYKNYSISRRLGNCNYYSNYRILECKIQYYYFYANNPFDYYSYILDGENITYANEENINQLTFVSNKLSDSTFIIRSNDIRNFSSIYVEIINKNCDFYSTLIREIGYYIIIDGKNDSTLRILFSNDFKKENNCSVSFEIENGNFDVDINYIKRMNYIWEGDVGNSIYHYFNNNEPHILHNQLFQISPLFFAYYNYSEQKDSFYIVITFKNEYLANKFNNNLKNLKNCVINDKSFLCLIDTNSSDFRKNQAQVFSIYIGYYKVDIDFIFYFLDSNSKQCKTKNENITDITLVIDLPKPKYLDLIYLDTESLMSIDEPIKSLNQLKYILKGNEINFLNSFFTMSFFGYSFLQKKFSLFQLGLNVLPKYYMHLENNEKKIYFLAENGQNLIAYIYTQEYSNASLDHIEYVGIKEHQFSFKKNYSTNSINITLDLYWVKNESKKEYQLYYVDKCGTKIFTDIIISVANLFFQRNYFVLNNNEKNMEIQRLIIYGPSNNYIRLFAYKYNNYENSIQALYNYSGYF